MMTKNEEARERPLLKARRFGTSASSVQALSDGKRRRFLLCVGKKQVHFDRLSAGYSIGKKLRKVLLCGEWLSGFDVCRQTTKARRKETKRL